MNRPLLMAGLIGMGVMLTGLPAYADDAAGDPVAEETETRTRPRFQDLTPEERAERREQFHNMTPEERAERREQFRNMTPEERANRREQFRNMPPEERRALRRRGDNDNNPPGRRGGPGTNWENPPGRRGGPGASADRRYGRRWDRDNNPPGRRGGPGTNWENPPGRRGGPGASADRRYGRRWDRDNNPPGRRGGPGTNWEILRVAGAGPVSVPTGAVCVNGDTEGQPSSLGLQTKSEIKNRKPGPWIRRPGFLPEIEPGHVIFAPFPTTFEFSGQKNNLNEKNECGGGDGTSGLDRAGGGRCGVD